jgi:hypothetical protein
MFTDTRRDKSRKDRMVRSERENLGWAADKQSKEFLGECKDFLGP